MPGSIDAAQFKEMLKKNNVVLIDVRTPEEFSQGHIPGARMIDYLQTETFRKELNRLDKNKTYLLYCRSGNRSKQAMQEMIQSGFKNVYELKGGIKSWPGELVK
ncbi:MAG: rhodanese-like domain-containing protein [Chitinophagaceae bacterium]|nr:rhodanese-like domain-containing protein [Chitinophagaceae bacterium]